MSKIGEFREKMIKNREKGRMCQKFMLEMDKVSVSEEKFMFELRRLERI